MRRLLVVATLLVGLSDCTAPKLAPPLTQLGDRPCDAAPDLRNPIALPMPTERGKSEDLTLDLNSKCVSDPAGKSLYQVLALPATNEPAILEIRVKLSGMVMLSPRLLLLDEAGHVLRDLRAGDFHYRGGVLSSLLRVHELERYVVVASDPAFAGQSIWRVEENMKRVMFYGPPDLEFDNGEDTMENYFFSLAGPVTATISTVPAPTKP